MSVIFVTLLAMDGALFNKIVHSNSRPGDTIVNLGYKASGHFNHLNQNILQFVCSIILTMAQKARTFFNFLSLLHFYIQNKKQVYVILVMSGKAYSIRLEM